MSEIKRAVAEKIWKLLGELKQGSDGSLTLRIGLRSGGSAALLWRKFQVAYTQRKLVVTFDDAGMNLVIPGRGGLDTPTEEDDGFPILAAEKNLREDVMKLAQSNPELRAHLVPLLQKTAGKEYD